MDLVNASACLNGVRSKCAKCIRGVRHSPLFFFFFFTSHFQSRNNIMDRLLTSSVSYSHAERWIEGSDAALRVESIHLARLSTDLAPSRIHCCTIAVKTRSYRTETPIKIDVSSWRYQDSRESTASSRFGQCSKRLFSPSEFHRNSLSRYRIRLRFPSMIE